VTANLDLVRSILAGWGRGDWSSADWADPEIEFEAVGGPDPVRVTEVAALTESWRDWVSTWSDYHAQAEQYRELDSDRVLVLIRHGGHGAASSVEVEAEGANVFHLRDGKW
jgi:ketosteroid isomerase-like protein